MQGQREKEQIKTELLGLQQQMVNLSYNRINKINVVLFKKNYQGIELQSYAERHQNEANRFTLEINQKIEEQRNLIGERDALIKENLWLKQQCDGLLKSRGFAGGSSNVI